jgi:hypothetical protein
MVVYTVITQKYLEHQPHTPLITAKPPPKLHEIDKSPILRVKDIVNVNNEHK